ncbi:MAG: amino acid permease [Candidatus Eisenbacteria sp.]|nr:amino acid permease [Candidatus Eisenbacteria bacterium]
MTKKLGTFLGVYTPTVLTVLGVIMYLRLGWLVGHLGLERILLVVLLANGITLLTALSFSAVATNSRVGVGGAYYIISRSLGIEIGGAIGVPLFLSQTFSVTLYAYGLAESLRIVWPAIPIQGATFLIIVAVALVSVPGARIALRSQMPLMILVGISLVALAIGALRVQVGSVASPPSGELTFWQGFAIFFPAVTGIMAGLGLSGDLERPGRAIPLGAILAVLTGFAVYLAMTVVLSLGATPSDLRGDSLVWTRIAILGPWLIIPGLWSAIFSSAVGSMLGAPRTLQALSRDGLAPSFFGKVTGDWREIVPGMALALLIALAAVLLGNLNAVAVLVSMFFLTVYGTANFVAAFEALSGDPSWRPKIRVPWLVNLAGGLACVAVMFLINPLVGLIAIVAELILWLLLSRKERTATWGDARRGLYEGLVRWALVRLSRRRRSARNWRPHILTFADGPVHDFRLVRFANWFCRGRGVVTVSQLVVSDLLTSDPDIEGRVGEMVQMFESENLVVFPEVDVVPGLIDGIVDVAQANGMAGIESNTILLGWPKRQDRLIEFLQVMRRLQKINKSFVLGKVDSGRFCTPEHTPCEIHVWWGGLQQNSDLMILLAWLLTRNSSWRRAKIKVMSLATTEMMRDQTEAYLRDLISSIRIEAEPEVVVKPGDASVAELIQRQSAHAAVVFLGLATPKAGEEEVYAERLKKLAGNLPVVFFVKNASLFVGELVGEPEDLSEHRTENRRSRNHEAHEGHEGTDHSKRCAE